MKRGITIGMDLGDKNIRYAFWINGQDNCGRGSRWHPRGDDKLFQALSRGSGGDGNRGAFQMGQPDRGNGGIGSVGRERTEN